MTERGSRYGIVTLAQADRRRAAATLQSLALLRHAPDAVGLAVSRLHAHQFADLVPDGSWGRRLRLITSETVDALPLSEAFRSMASSVDIVLFVPEGVVLDPDYLDGIREIAGRWQDMVGAIDVVDRMAGDDRAEGNISPPARRTRRASWLPRSLRPKTLAAHILWVRVAACGGIKFVPFPHNSEYLAFAFVLDQLRSRGRTCITGSGAAVRLQLRPERRSGFEAGRTLYRALTRIGEWRQASDLAFADRAGYLDPRREKIMLFGEQMVRYAASAATRAHVGSFIRGMWAARREEAASRHRIRDDIRKLR